MNIDANINHFTLDVHHYFAYFLTYGSLLVNEFFKSNFSSDEAL